MSRAIGWILLALVVCLQTIESTADSVSKPTSSYFHQSRTVNYSDPLGNEWTRSIVIETFVDRTLLLVTENPTSHLDDSSVSQVTVARFRLDSGKTKELDERYQYYYQLKDLSSRSIDYYRSYSARLNRAAQPLWQPTKPEWTLDDEEDFSSWFASTITKDFFKGKGILFDCADFALLVRWIYAHDHRLPVANNLGESGKLFGHFSGRSDWDKLKTDPNWQKDERFKAALNYLMDSTYTHSIFEDLYPVDLSPKFVTPGSVLLVLYSSTTGHTQVIKKIGPQSLCAGSGCISTLWGNEPSSDEVYEQPAWIRNLGNRGGGFMRWRWPVFRNGKWALEVEKKMPGYSLTQYSQPDLNDNEFEQYSEERLGINLTLIEKAKNLVSGLSEALFSRLSLTAEGHVLCHLQYCDPTGTLYDELSTPSKDKRFRESRDRFLNLISKIPANDPDLIGLKESLQTQGRIFHSQIKKSLFDYIFNVNKISDLMSSDPAVSFSARWGLNNDITTETWTWFQVFGRVWNKRERLVSMAIDACHPETPTLTCDPSSSEIQRLSTARIDDGLRQLHRRIHLVFPSLDPQVQNEVSDFSKKVYANSFCEWNLKGECSAFDYFFTNKDYIKNLSSDPAHIKRRRDGFLN